MKVGADFSVDFLNIEFNAATDVEDGAKILGRIVVPRSRADIWEQIRLCVEAIYNNGSSIAMLGSGDRKLYPVGITEITSNEMASYITIRSKFYVLAGFDAHSGRVYLPRFGPGMDEPELGDVRL